mgnify:FL=1
MKKINKNLALAGYPLIELEGLEGGLIFVLPFGGRVLGLFTKDKTGNFFWVNSLLNDESGTKRFFETKGWKNTGGDRTWAGPELELFIKDVAKPWDTYEVPATIDPGNYSVKQYSKTVHMLNSARVFLYRSHRECEIEIDKKIRMIPNPLRYKHIDGRLTRELEYIGYEQVTTLRLVSNTEPGVRLDIWNLIQVPAGGELIIPTIVKTKPRIYFGSPGDTHVKAYPDHIRLTIDAKKKYKTGIHAASLIGRAGYLRQEARDTWTLLVRNFFINPSGEYVDVPWDDETDFGYAMQCYNDDGGFGRFGELEYHTPAIGEETDRREYTDNSQVWAFRGDKQHILEVCRCLLGYGNQVEL